MPPLRDDDPQAIRVVFQSGSRSVSHGGDHFVTWVLRHPDGDVQDAMVTSVLFIAACLRRSAVAERSDRPRRPRSSSSPSCRPSESAGCPLPPVSACRRRRLPRPNTPVRNNQRDLLRSSNSPVPTTRSAAPKARARSGWLSHPTSATPRRGVKVRSDPNPRLTAQAANSFTWSSIFHDATLSPPFLCEARSASNSG